MRQIAVRGVGGWGGRVGAASYGRQIVGAGMPGPGAPGPLLGGGGGFSPAQLQQMIHAAVAQHMGQVAPRPPMGPAGVPLPTGAAGSGMGLTPGSGQQPFGFFGAFSSSGSIAAAGTATITMNPQRPFRIERVATFAAAGVWLITSLTNGVDPQQVNLGNGVDSALFATSAFGVALRGSTAWPGITISMGLSNISGAAATAQGWAIVGTALA